MGRRRALGRPAEAAGAYETALDQSPNDASIHHNLATALVDLGRADEAVTHLRGAVRLDPECTKTRFLLGTLLYQQRRAEDALVQFREASRGSTRRTEARGSGSGGSRVNSGGDLELPRFDAHEVWLAAVQAGRV